MAGLILTDADDFGVDVRFSANGPIFELAASAWVESEDPPDRNTVTALRRRAGAQTGARNVQSLNVGFEAAPVGDPVYDHLIEIAEASGNVWLRVAAVPQKIRDKSAADTDELAIAAASYLGTFSGDANGESDIRADDTIEAGLWFKHFTDETAGSEKYHYAALVNKGQRDEVGGTSEARSEDKFRFCPVVRVGNDAKTAAGQEADLNGTDTVGEYRSHLLTPFAGDLAAAQYQIIKPGGRRPWIKGKVSVGGSYSFETGQQVGTSVDFNPDVRLPLVAYAVL